MVTIFYNPMFGILLALVNIVACLLASGYLVLRLNAYVDNDKLTDKLLEHPVTILLALLCLCLIKIPVCLVLIAGILKKSYHLMAAWICVAFVYLVGIFFYTLVAICSSFINHLSLKDNALRIVPSLVVFVIQIALFYPIFVLYQSILVIRLKRDGLYEGPADSNHDDSELVDADEVY